MSMYIVSFLIVLMEMVFLEITASTFFFSREDIRKRVKILGILAAALVSTINAGLFYGMFWIKLFFVFLISYLYIAVFYQTTAADALGNITFYYSVMSGIDFIGIRILLCVPGIVWEHWLYYGIIFASKSAELGIGLVIRKIWKRGNRVQAVPKEIRRLMFFSGISILIGAFMKKFLEENHSVPEDMMILITCIVCVSNCSLLYLLLAARAEIEREYLKDAAGQIRRQLEIYKSKQDLYIKQGRRIHEYKNQLLTIGHMLEENQTSKALCYIRSLTGSIAKELDKVYTNNPIADAILNMKKQEALDKKISVNFLCSDLQNVVLTEEEIIILLGNLLDNAIEAASQCEGNKSIQVRIIQEKKQLVAAVKNTCTQPLRIEKGRLASTKDDREAHGFGLAAIEDIVEKYDGSFAIRKLGEYVKAAVVIPNP